MEVKPVAGFNVDSDKVERLGEETIVVEDVVEGAQTGTTSTASSSNACSVFFSSASAKSSVSINDEVDGNTSISKLFMVADQSLKEVGELSFSATKQLLNTRIFSGHDSHSG